MGKLPNVMTNTSFYFFSGSKAENCCPAQTDKTAMLQYRTENCSWGITGYDTKFVVLGNKGDHPIVLVEYHSQTIAGEVWVVIPTIRVGGEHYQRSQGWKTLNIASSGALDFSSVVEGTDYQVRGDEVDPSGNDTVIMMYALRPVWVQQRDRAAVPVPSAIAAGGIKGTNKIH